MTVTLVRVPLADAKPGTIRAAAAGLGERPHVMAQFAWTAARQKLAYHRGMSDAEQESGSAWLPPTIYRPWSDVATSADLDEVEEAILFGTRASIRLFRRMGERRAVALWEVQHGEADPIADAHLRSRERQERRANRWTLPGGSARLPLLLHSPDSRFQFATRVGGLLSGTPPLHACVYVDASGIVDWRLLPGEGGSAS